MISAIRNKFGNRLLDIFIWLSIFAFVLLYIVPGGNKAKLTDQWAVSVNDESASYQEYRTILDSLRERARNMGGSEKPKEENLKKITLDYLENILLFRSQEKKLNIVLSPGQVRACALRVAPDWAVSEDGKIDINLIKERLQGTDLQMGMIEERINADFEQAVQELKGRVMDEVLRGGLYIPEFVLNNYYRNEYASKKFSLLTLPYQKYASLIEKQTITDQQLKSFFDRENQATKRYWTEEKRSGEVWTFKPEDFGIKISDKQVKAYYYQNRETKFVKHQPQVQVRHILFEVDKKHDSDGQKLANVQELAGKVRADLANDPSKFAEFAKNYSNDKATADKGGLLPFFARGEKDKALEAAAFDLKIEGEISEIIDTDHGLEILQLVSQKPAEFKTLESVSDEIKKQVLQQQFNKLFAVNAKRVIAQAVKEPDAFKRLVDSKKAAKSSLALQAIGEQPAPELSKLFELRKDGSRGFLQLPEHGKIIVLLEVVPAKPKDLSQIKAEVLADFKKDWIINEIQKTLEQAVAELQQGASLKDVANKLGAEYEQTPLITNDSFGKIENLKKKGFPIEVLREIKRVGGFKTDISTSTTQPSGYLGVLDEMQKPAAADFASKKRTIMRTLLDQYRMAFGGSFIASLRKNATIKVNTALINV